MSNSSEFQTLKESKMEIYRQIKHNFNKIQNNPFPTLLNFFEEMDKIVRGHTFKIVKDKTDSGRIFHYLELKTSRNARMEFCEQIFKDNINIHQLGNDILYSNSYLGFIIAKHIEMLRISSVKELKHNKLLPIRWKHNNGSRTKTVFLTIPRGEIYYFRRKAQHLQQFTKNWLKALVKAPVVYYTLNNVRYNATRDEAFLQYNGQRIPISPRKKKIFHCFKRFMYFAFNNILMHEMENRLGGEHSFWNEVYGNQPEDFWYYRERSSSEWAARAVREAPIPM